MMTMIVNGKSFNLLSEIAKNVISAYKENPNFRMVYEDYDPEYMYAIAFENNEFYIQFRES